MPTSTNSPLRAGIIGTGFIGAVHLDALRRLGIEVAAISASSDERAVQKAREWGVTRGYGSVAELVADPLIDVVHITSPNDLHVEHATLALDAGKHVVCEKPLAVDSASSRRLRDHARASGLVHAVNFNVRFYPMIVEARSRVIAGELGATRLVTGRYFQDWLAWDTDWNWRVEAGQSGPLRAISDIGSHLFDVVSFVIDSPIAEVFADLSTFVEVRKRPVGPVETFATVSDSGQTTDYRVDTEDAGSVLVHFANGARGNLAVSQVSHGRKNSVRFEVTGARASLAWEAETSEELWLGYRDEANRIELRGSSWLSPESRSLARLPSGHGEGFENTFLGLYRAVYSHIEEGGPKAGPARYPTFDDGHDELLVTDAVAASAAARSWVTVAAD